MAFEEGNNKFLIVFVLLLFLLFVVVIAILILNPPPKKANISSTINLDQFEIKNDNDFALYNCSFSLTSRGDKTAYMHFFSPYYVQNCKTIEVAYANLTCRLENWINKTKNYAKATQLPNFPEHSQTSIQLENFYTNSTRKNEAFLTNRKPGDVFSLTIMCRNSSGKRIQNTVSF